MHNDTANTSWEQEFDEKFNPVPTQGIVVNLYLSNLKSFITQLLVTARAEERERIEKLCEGMKYEHNSRTTRYSRNGRNDHEAI